MHKTTVSFRQALLPAAGDYPTSIGTADVDVSDLGVNARKYLREDLR